MTLTADLHDIQSFAGAAARHLAAAMRSGDATTRHKLLREALSLVDDIEALADMAREFASSPGPFGAASAPQTVS